MARGYIYCITNGKDVDVKFNENYYYDYLDTLHVDYVKDMDQDESELPLKWLEETMQDLGAITGHGRDMKGFGFMFWFRDVETAKRLHFGPRLEKLKKNVEALTLEDVMKAAPCLDQILDDDYGSMVLYADGESESTVNLDYFIRSLKPCTTYYVRDRVILMH